MITHSKNCISKDLQSQVSQIRYINDFEGDGDKWVYKISIEGMPEAKIYPFKFDESYSSTDFFGSPFTCVVTKLADNKIQETITQSAGQNMVVVKTIENDSNMSTVTTAGGVTCVIKFTKM
ncbi:uncharacterized protein LOC106867514 isoform X2 [Octopus bimaculoides]|uniref:uncharacterized protein LOC106867514 isoform X2 n=1 Tax=Octopus bimaculoides TaxID=37653 RepID=UPI00071E4682|nr:uncharacterized protein LOC106867514 isoform X2 [Octopus bimaculoides]|eukprot:XP_014767888.1 PREDICTED: uncharacterized protein LOC106867514 isoform X2 [Octopus bimaculoides]